MAVSIGFSHTEASTTLVSRRWSIVWQVLLASFFLAFCAQIKIVLPFTPVPLTMQTLAVMMIGVTLGSRKGAFAILTYFAEILIGMPVLSNLEANPLVFMGPKGGYILGFLVQAYLMGWTVEKTENLSRYFFAFVGLIACLIQLSLGMLGLVSFVGWQNVLGMGFYPFIGGEILKVFLLCFFLKPSLQIK
jgi:biotin transport system substrate-specific component